MERGLASKWQTWETFWELMSMPMRATVAQARELVLSTGEQRPADASQLYGKLLGNSGGPQAQSARKGVHFAHQVAQGAPS